MFKRALSKRLYLSVIGVLFVSLLIAGSSFALNTESYKEGFSFGEVYQDEILNNINIVMAKAPGNNIDMEQAVRYARESEDLYNMILPEKIEWMKGVSDGSGIPYQDILVFNTVDRMITGFMGECTTFMAHGKALASGSGTIIAKNRDLGSQTLSEIGLHQAAKHPKGAVYKAAYIDIPETEKTYKFVGSRTAGRWGYGMGVNEYQVTVADNDAPSRDILGFVKSLHDNDLVRLILERASTAREGVDVIAALVPKFGQAWNGIIYEIGDPNELWVVAITGPRWVAKKYTDTVTARSNQYQIRDDYDLAAPDLVSFAIEQGWVPKGTERIDFTKVYSTDELYPADNDLSKRKNVESLYNTQVRYQRAMELLEKNIGKITPELLTSLCRDHYDTYKLPSGKVIELNQIPIYSSQFAGWGKHEWQVYEPKQDEVPIHMYIRSICSHGHGGSTASSAILVSRPNVSNELGLMLHAFMPPCNSTYIPFYVGITEIDHRYTGPEAAVAFQLIKARSFSQYKLYHNAVRKAFDPYETRLFEEIPTVESQFEELKKADKEKEANAMLTQFVKDKCVQALSLVQAAQDNMTQASRDASKWSR